MDKIKSQKQQKLDININGKAVRSITFETHEEGITQDGIRKVIRDFQEANKVQMGNDFSISVDMLFQEAGWRPSPFQKFNDNYKTFELFNIHAYYDVGDELEQKFLEKINIDKFEDYKFKKFRIYAKYDGPHGGGCHSKYNDCLYACIYDSFKNIVSKYWKYPSSLKKFLKIDRCDKIDIDDIQKIEEKLNISINVSGDYIHQTNQKKINHIELELINGHYRSINNKGHTKLLRNYQLAKKRKSKSLFVYNETHYFDGDKTYTYDYNFEKKHRGVMVFRVKGDLKEEHKLILMDIELLKERTGYDLIECKNIGNIVLKSFFDLS